MCSRDLVDDENDGTDGDCEAEDRFAAVAEVPEHERRRQSHQDDAGQKRDQERIDERERGREDEVGRRPPEGEAPTEEQRHRDGSDRGDREPERDRRSIGCVASDHELEHRRDGQDRHQQLEQVLASELFHPVHALKVLHALICRLLPE